MSRGRSKLTFKHAAVEQHVVGLEREGAGQNAVIVVVQVHPNHGEIMRAFCWHTLPVMAAPRSPTIRRLVSVGGSPCRWWRPPRC